MNKYETMFIVDPRLDEEQTQERVEKIKNILETQAQFEKIDEWGKKRLAYEIQDQKEGYYVLAHFSAEPNFPTELERIFRITDGIIRHLIIRLDEK